MTISKYAIEQFVQRELDDWDWLKEEQTSTIDQAISQLESPPDASDWLRHQKDCFLIGVDNPGFNFFLKTGLGKTRLALELFKWRKCFEPDLKALVLVPNLSNLYGWKKQVEKHTPELTCCMVQGETKKKRNQALGQDADLYVLNYAGAVALCSDLVEQKNKKARKREIIPEIAQWIMRDIDFLVLDESHSCKNHRTSTYKLCKLLGQEAKYKYGMTATPFSRNPEDLWTQFQIVDEGETLGGTLTLFREAFFRQEINEIVLRDKRTGQIQKRKVYSYSLRADRKQDLYRTLKHKSVFYDLDEGDLPLFTRIPLPVAFSEETRKYYDEAVRQARESKGNLIAIENAFMSMRQISSGFLGFSDDDTGEKIKIEFKENPKLEALKDFVDSMAPDEKIIVFHDFIFSGDKISKMLDGIKVPHVRLYGKTKDPAQVLEQFETDKNCQVLLANSKSGGTGLNLQFCRYAVFYESPVSATLREQNEGRIYRTGQTRATFAYDLVMEGGIDEKILQFAKEGRDLKQELLSGKLTLDILGT